MWKKKKEDLIPLEQSKKVIYLEQRGHKREKKSIGSVCFAVLAVICLLYCLAIALFMGYGTTFFMVWGGLSVLFGLLSFLLSRRKLLRKLPRAFKIIVVIGFVAGVLCFGIVEGFICSRFSAKAQPGADYVIVLGAQWKNSGPSYVLKKRLDKALEYLEANPDTYVIVSGGQGSDEPISEAQGMYEYLMAAGIEKERILQEDKSTSTYENLYNSAALLDMANDRVVLVTNNFHVFRGEKIAKKMGYAHIEGLAASSYPAMLPNNMLREFLGVIKDFWIGKL